MSSIPNKAPNVITAAGAVTPAEYNNINAASALALTLAVPSVDGQLCTFIDETGHAHTVTTPASGINGATHIATFGGTAGSSIQFVSRNSIWWVVGTPNGVTLS